MADVIGRLVVKLESDASGVDEGIDRAKSSFDGFKSVVQGVALGAGMAVANFAIQAGQSLLQFGEDSVGAASDLNETLSKTEVQFGDSADAVKAFAQNAAGQFGQGRQQALDAAATFAAFGKAAGLAGGDLVGFSTNFVGLASDLASFNNTSPEQAIQAIGAALRGEAEPMRAYGVLLDDASMRQKALELGIISTTKGALTPQQKILAAQALIYEQTSAAQGDFARTSDGLANQQRILDAQWANMQATLGQALLPVVLAVTQGLNSLLQSVLPPLSAIMTTSVIPAMTALGDGLGSLIGYLSGAASGSGDLHERLAKVPEPMQGIADLIGGTLVPAAQNIVRVFEQAMGPAIQTIMGWFDSLGETVTAQTNGPLNFLRGWIAQNMPRIQQIVENVLAAITAFWEAHGARITSVVETMFGIVTRLWETGFRTILNTVQVILQLLTGDFEGAGTTLRSILNDWQRFFETSIRTIVNGIRQWFNDVDWGGLGRSIIEGIGNGIRNAGSWLAGQAGQAALDALEAAKRALGISSPSRLAASEIGEPFVQGIGAGLVGAGGWLMEQARRLALDVADAAAGALGAQPLALGPVAAPEAPELPAVEPPEPVGEIAAPELPALPAPAMPTLPALQAPAMPELPALTAPAMPELPALQAPDLSAAWAAVGQRLGTVVAGWWAAIGPQAAALAERLRGSLAAVDWRGTGGEMIAEIGAGLLSAGGWLVQQARGLALDVADAAAGALGAQPLALGPVAAAAMPELPAVEPLEPVEAGPVGEIAAPEMPVLPAIAAPQMPELPALEAPPIQTDALDTAWAAVGQRLGTVVAGWWAAIGPQAAALAERLRGSVAAVDWRSTGGEMIAEAGAGLLSAGGWLVQQARGLALDVADAAAGALGGQPLALGPLGMGPEVFVPPVMAAAEALRDGETADTGWRDALARLQEQIEAALGGLADTLEMGAAGSTRTAVAGGFGQQVGGGITIRLEQNFYGPADAPTVRRASGAGILEALRAAGAR